jgi:hypothetical protein
MLTVKCVSLRHESRVLLPCILQVLCHHCSYFVLVVLCNNPAFEYIIPANISFKMEALPIDILKKCILPFVGDLQFRFFAAVNKAFYAAYTGLYRNKKTRRSVTSVDHVKLYLEEVKERPGYRSLKKLCSEAAKLGR